MLRRIAIVVALFLLVVIGVGLVFRGAAAWREQQVNVARGSTLVPTPVGRVAVRLQGGGARGTIMLVHGTAAWGGFWRDVANRLASKGWRVVAVDLPPFGYSDRDPSARYNRTTQARRLAAVARQLNQGPVVVLGHSFGAGAATEFALRYPRQVQKLVLVDAALGSLDPAPGRSALERTLSLRPVAELVTASTITNPLATEGLLSSFMARKAAAGPWVDTIQQPMHRIGTTSGYAAWLPALFATDDGSWSRRSARLASIRMPVAIIWGDADTVTPLWQGRQLARLTRARPFTVLKDVGHIPHVEAPAAFGAALEQVLAKGEE